MEKDPVCGMQVDPETAEDTTHYQGRTYYFCSAECKREFELDPRKYVEQAA
jgi:Cu+-exporting ATPase